MFKHPTTIQLDSLAIDPCTIAAIDPQN